ncbi:uncharacterized protein [Choristoneura fumiferana]|uniref:uncharacterized protein n=1 Tax=Choristoneura fumiferana TaxID=7141 RepID=UPI003D158434
MLSIFKSFSSSKKKDCALECIVPETPAVHEFVGPVRIVLVDTTTCTYSCRRLVAALVAAAYFLMGAVTITVLYYMMVSEKPLFVQLHVLFSTFAMICFVPSGVLIYSPYNGSSALLKEGDKITDHMSFQFLSFALIAAAAVCVYLSVDDLLSLSIHSIASYVAVCSFLWNMLFGILHHFALRGRFTVCKGAVTIVLVLISAPLGLFSLKRGLHLKTAHLSFGIPAFLASSISFISGLYMPVFTNWVDPSVKYIVLGFIVFATIFIVTTAFIKCLRRL